MSKISWKVSYTLGIVAPITSVPNYEFISSLILQLNVNAAPVQSNLRNGLLGLLYLLAITPAEYNALSATKFIPSENPGAAPPMWNAATNSQLATPIRENNTGTIWQCVSQ
jgi:hypothetical protein